MATVQENGIVSCQKLANKMIQHLTNNGMVITQPAAFTTTTYKATLKTTATINIASSSDPLSEWYIVIDAETNPNKINIMVGTQVQFGSSQAVIRSSTGKGIGQLAAYDDPSESCTDCSTYTAPTPPSGIPTWTTYEFIDRTMYSTAQQSSFPMSYILITSNRGIAFCIWEEGVDDMVVPTMSYAVIQRSVNNKTGEQRNTGKMPVYCLYGINRSAIQAHYRFVVKEQDVFVPTIVVRSDRDTADGCRSINTHQQVAVTEEFNYAIFFPNNLNSQRFAYPQDDLDLIAYTSADVISASSNVTLPVYNEASMRTYKALQSTGMDQTGMRILILTS